MVLTVDGTPAGWAGWLVYPPRSQLLETTTYLTPPWWGTGLNGAAKSLQWGAARRAGLLLVASIHAENHRSIAALRRLWPHTDPQVVFEEHKQRVAHVFPLNGPPACDVTWQPGDLQRAAARLTRLDRAT